MKKIIALMFSMIVLTVSACAPQATVLPTVISTVRPTDIPTVVPTDLPTAIPTVVFTATPTAEPTKEPVTPTKVNLKTGQRLYTNDAFKLAIKYPGTSLTGPFESIDGDKLSVQFNSFESLGAFLGVKKPAVDRNASYSIQIDYKRNQPADAKISAWGNFYDIVAKLKDGETYISRNTDDGSELSKTTRLRALQVGRFSGFEAVVVWSDPKSHMRRIVLFDPERKDGIDIWAQWDADWDAKLGVDMTDMKKWIEVYERGEKASSPSLNELYEMIESITVE